MHYVGTSADGREFDSSLRRGDPGYATSLDADGDGVACNEALD